MFSIDEKEALQQSMLGSQFYLADYQSNFVNETHSGNEISPKLNFNNNIYSENENETKIQTDDIVIDLSPANITIKQKLATERQENEQAPPRVTRTMKICNALIAVVGISDYDSMPNLDCVLNDYKNIEHAFHNVRGYSIVTFDKNNKIIHKKLKEKTNDENHKNSNNNTTNSNNANKNYVTGGDCDTQTDTFEEKKNSSSAATAIKNTNNNIARKKRKTDYKLRWIDSEIFDFNDQILSILENNKYNNDCLMYFISCHGDLGGIIYDSEENKIPLISIFEQFNNQNCIQLRNKPKIYFIDACRGDIRTKRITNSNIPLLVQSNQKTMENHNNHSIEHAIWKLSTSTTNNTNTSIFIDHSNSLIPTSTAVTSKDRVSNNVFSKYSYNREIYANTEGYAVVEPSSKGAYLIRSITKAFVNDKIFVKDFDTIMIHTRNILLKLMGKTVECGAQVIDDRSNIPTKLFFQKPK